MPGYRPTPISVPQTTTETGAPLCVHCKHYSGRAWNQCYRRSTFNLVTGWETEPRYADNERSGRFLWFGKNRCGPEARFFEPAEPRALPPPPLR